MASRCLAGRQLKGVDAVTSVQRGSHHHDVSTASGNVGLERNASIWLCDVCHIAADHQPNRLSFEVPMVFYRFDGIYLLITTVMQKTWSVSNWYFTSNPIEGIGGLELPQHNLIDPGLWLVAHLPPSIGPTAAMTFYAALLAVSICWLATRLGMAPLPTLFAGWLGPLLALPYIYPSLGFDFLWGVPTYILLIALDIAVILLFLDFGRGPFVADTVRFFAIAAICGYQFIQFPNFAPVSLLVLIFFGVVALAMAASMHERFLKLAAAIVLGCAAATVFGGLIFGLYGFAKPTFFWYEFFPRPGTLRDVSFFIADHSRWPVWIVYGLSLAGALHAALRATRKCVGWPAVSLFSCS